MTDPVPPADLSDSSVPSDLPPPSSETAAPPDTPAPPDPNAAHLIKYSILTPHGRLNGQLAIPVGATMGLGELAFNAMGVGEQLVRMGVDYSEKLGREISCCKGCGACCRQVVPLSPPEALMIADLVAGARSPRNSILALRFSAAESVLKQAGLTNRFATTPETDAAGMELARNYFLLNMACPFLEEESCSIHPYRPSMCREYLVTSPAAWCASPYAHTIERVPVSVRLSRSLALLTGELLEEPPRLIPLTLAVQFARENKPLATRQWEAKPMIERLIELMSAA